MNCINELNKIKKLIELGEQKQALMRIKKLLKQNDGSESAKFEYARLLMHNPKTVDKGIELMTTLSNTIHYNKYALLELGKCEKCKGNLFVARAYFNEMLVPKDNSTCYTIGVEELIYLDILEEKYEEAYNLFKQNSEALEKNGCEWNNDNIRYYLEYKLGILSEEEKKKPINFFRKQLVEYNEFEVINHMKFHLDGNENNSLHIIFNDIDLNELYSKCNNFINNALPFYSTLCDIYLAKCDINVGTINDKQTNLVLISTIANTKNIIAIKPVLYDFYDDNIKITLCKSKTYKK